MSASCVVRHHRGTLPAERTLTASPRVVTTPAVYSTSSIRPCHRPPRSSRSSPTPGCEVLLLDDVRLEGVPLLGSTTSSNTPPATVGRLRRRAAPRPGPRPRPRRTPGGTRRRGGVRQHHHARQGAVDAGLPGALGAHHLTALVLGRLLPQVPDVPVGVLGVPVQVSSSSSPSTTPRPAPPSPARRRPPWRSLEHLHLDALELAVDLPLVHPSGAGEEGQVGVVDQLDEVLGGDVRGVVAAVVDLDDRVSSTRRRRRCWRRVAGRRRRRRRPAAATRSDEGQASGRVRSSSVGVACRHRARPGLNTA